MSNDHNIQEQVLEKIRAGQVSMRSRAYFVFRTGLIAAAAVLVLASSLFLFSFIFFSVHESGLGYLLEFSERGLLTFVTLFPWISLFVLFLLLIALESLVYRFRPVYRRPLLRIFLWLVVISIIGSTLLALTPLHSFLLSEADNDRLPILGSLYEQIHESHQKQGVYRGDIVSVAGTYFVIAHNDTDLDSDEGSWTIQPPAGFKLSTLTLGEIVYVAGRLMHGVIYAYGIHPISGNE